MDLHLEWQRPIVLRDGTRQDLIYVTDFDRLPDTPGVYVFGRRFGKQIEALYVGKANRLRGRVKGQFNNLRLMQHLGTRARGGACF